MKRSLKKLTLLLLSTLLPCLSWAVLPAPLAEWNPMAAGSPTVSNPTSETQNTAEGLTSGRWTIKQGDATVSSGTMSTGTGTAPYIDFQNATNFYPGDNPITLVTTVSLPATTDATAGKLIILFDSWCKTKSIGLTLESLSEAEGAVFGLQSRDHNSGESNYNVAIDSWGVEPATVTLSDVKPNTSVTIALFLSSNGLKFYTVDETAGTATCHLTLASAIPGDWSNGNTGSPDNSYARITFGGIHDGTALLNYTMTSLAIYPNEDGTTELDFSLPTETSAEIASATANASELVWNPSEPSDQMDATITASVATTLNMDKAITAHNLTLTGSGDITISGTNNLTAATTVVDANTDVSGITGTTSLGAVTINADKTLIIDDSTTITSAVAEGATIKVDGTLESKELSATTLGALRTANGKIIALGTESNGVALPFGFNDPALNAFLTFSGGTHTMTLGNNSGSATSLTTTTYENPLLWVKDGASLTFTMKDFGGQRGQVNKNAILRVAAGSQLTFKSDGSNTGYFGSVLYLDGGASRDTGAKLTIDNNNKSGRYFSLFGMGKDGNSDTGIDPERVQIRVPDSVAESYALIQGDAINIDGSGGYSSRRSGGVSVGENATLYVENPITGGSNGNGFFKYGAGKLVLESESSTVTRVTVEAGILEVAGDLTTDTVVVTVTDGATLSGTGSIAGALTLNANSTLDATAGELTVSGDVTFPESGTLNVKLPADAELPAQIIAKTGLTEGKVTVGTLSVTIGENAAVETYELAATATGYSVREPVSTVCTILDTSYTSIQEGIDACVAMYEAGTFDYTALTITVTAATTETVTLPEGWSFTLVGTIPEGTDLTVIDAYGTELESAESVYGSTYTTPTYTVSAMVGGATKKYATIKQAVDLDGSSITLIANTEVTEDTEIPSPVAGDYTVRVMSGATLNLESETLNKDGNNKTFADNATIVVDEGAKVLLTSGGGYFNIQGAGSVEVAGNENFIYGMAGGGSGGVKNNITANLVVPENQTFNVRAWNNCVALGGGNITVNGSIVANGGSDTSPLRVKVAQNKTLSGNGIIHAPVSLESGAIIDASNGPITLASNATLTFPPSTNEDGLITLGIVDVILPAETTGFPARFIYCSGATETGAKSASVGVKLKGESDFLYNDEIVLMVNNVTGLADGYGVMQYTCIGDGIKYMSVMEAVAAGATSIVLQEDTLENISIPSGVTLTLYAHRVIGDLTIEGGATLQTMFGAVTGNLKLQPNATLDVVAEFNAGEEVRPFTVGGEVTFPSGALTVITDESAKSVKLGVPRQLIKSNKLLTPGIITNDTTITLYYDDQGSTNENIKIVTTSTTYELVNIGTSAYTFDGVDYESIEQALQAYTTMMNNGIVNNGTIKFNHIVYPENTIIIDVGENNTVTFDVTGAGIASIAEDIAIRIKSGNLKLINNDATTVTSVASLQGKAVLVGADDNDGAISETACGLYIGSYVIVSGNTEAIDVINGTISGEGTISGTLTLANETTVDATHGILTMSEGSTIIFPKETVVTGDTTTYTNNTIKVMPKAGDAYPSQFIVCSSATAEAIENVNVIAILNGEEMTDTIFELTRKRNDEDVVTGYAVMGDDIVAISINGSKVETWKQLSDAVEAATSTGQVILTADATINADYATNIYTSGYNVTLTTSHTLMGTLTLMHGTVVSVASDCSLTATNIIVDTNAIVTIEGAIASENPIVNNGVITTSTPLAMAKIIGTLRLTNGSSTNGFVSTTKGTIVDEDAIVEVNGYLYGNLTVQNATVNGQGYILMIDSTLTTPLTLTGAGTILPTVQLFNGSTINKVGYESNHLVIPNLAELTSETITVKANALANVINTKNVTLNSKNFVLDMGDSGYTVYNADDETQTDDTSLVALVVATNNGDNTLGVAKINYNLVGVDIKANGYAQSLAAYAYSYGVLEVMGVYNNREAFQLFTNLSITGFTSAGYANIGDYEFGVDSMTIVAETTGSGASAITTKYVVVMALVDNANQTADYREGTTVVVTDENGTAIVDQAVLTNDEAIAYGLIDEESSIPTGYMFVKVPYADLFEDAEGPSTTKQFKVKATNESQQD